jgi:nucleoid-associated protein YgaU
MKKHWLTLSSAILLLMLQASVMADDSDTEQIRKAAESLMTGNKAGTETAASDSKVAVPDKPDSPPAAKLADAEKPAKPAAPHVESEVIISKDKDGKKITQVKVAEGDSLSAIAERLYGSKDLYLQIFEANRDKLKLESPDHIRSGTVLLIPEPKALEASATVQVAPADQPPAIPPSAMPAQ